MSSERHWFDGPKLAEWLDKFVPYENLTDNQQRRVRDWRKGGAASLFAIDSILCDKTELSIWDIPEEICREQPPRHGRPLSESKRRELLERLQRGESQRGIARELGIAPKTVRTWAKKAAA